MHLVTHIFITDNKKPSFSNIGQNLGTPEEFLKSVPFLQTHRRHGCFNGDELKTNIQMTLQKVFLNSQL